MSKIPVKKYAIALYDSIKEAKDFEIPGIIKSFVYLLVKHHCLHEADKIIRAFSEYFSEKQRQQEVEIVSASQLSEEEKDVIIKKLTLALHKMIILKNSVNPGIRGGAVIKYGDTVIDGSIKRRLELLESSLSK